MEELKELGVIFEDVRDTVTDHYWKSYDTYNQVKDELEEVRERLIMVRNQLKLDRQDYDFMWDRKEEDCSDNEIENIMNRHGLIV